MPDNPPKLRNSERGDFRRCPWRWWMAWREGLTPKGPPAPPLWFGTGIHLALAEWYRPPEPSATKGTRKAKDRGFIRSADPRETWEKFVDDEITYIKTTYKTSDVEGEAFEAEWVEAKELGTIMLTEYLSWYGRDESWEFIEPEQSGSVYIPDYNKKAKQGVPPHILVEFCFTFDGVFRDHGSGGAAGPLLKLLETKTAAQISTKHLTLDDQAGSYWAVATAQLREDGKIGKKETLDGITYNFLRKAKPDSRPTNAEGQSLNKDGSVSKVQPTRNFLREHVSRSPAERNTQLKRIGAEVRHMNMFRSGELPLYKNPTRDCSWDCAFFSMCELHEAGSDWKEYRDLVFNQVDPYRSHRHQLQK